MTPITLTSPLFTDWSEQYVRLYLSGVEPGAALELAVDGVATPFQFTGQSVAEKAKVLVKIDFAKDQTRHFVFSAAGSSSTDLTVRDLPFTGPVSVGSQGRELVVSPGAGSVIETLKILPRCCRSTRRGARLQEYLRP